MTIHYKKHGFHSEQKKEWGKLTYDPFDLTNLLTECTPEALRAYARMCRNYAASSKPEGAFEHELLKPFQKHGVSELLRRPNVLLADEMGLGKTVQCAVALQELQQDRVLVVCPASLILNWEKEITKWTALSVTAILNGKTKLDMTTHVYVVSYANVGKYTEIMSASWDVVIMDESHFLKNPKAQRTKNVLRLKAGRRWALSGTPIRNRPRDIHPLLRTLLPGFHDFHSYGKRYCDAHQEFIPGRGMTWNYDGASRTDELNTRLRSTVMLRRMKADVLEQLPAKIKQTILLDDPRVVKAEKTAMSGVPKDESRLAAEYTATIRKNTAIAKLPEVVKFAEKCLEEVEKIVIFAYHRDIINELGEHFGNALTIDGRTPTKKRDSIVEQFQTDPERRVFIGQIEACGTGITLTAAHTVIFAETTWTPSDMEQAADRCHRIGQSNSVVVYTLLTRGTIDEAVHRVLESKSLTIKQCLQEARRTHG